MEGGNIVRSGQTSNESVMHGSSLLGGGTLYYEPSFIDTINNVIYDKKDLFVIPFNPLQQIQHNLHHLALNSFKVILSSCWLVNGDVWDRRGWALASEAREAAQPLQPLECRSFS